MHFTKIRNKWKVRIEMCSCPKQSIAYTALIFTKLIISRNMFVYILPNFIQIDEKCRKYSQTFISSLTKVSSALNLMIQLLIGFTWRYSVLNFSHTGQETYKLQVEMY